MFPRLSVVIAARSGVAPVLRCLGSLENLAEWPSFEVIVVNCCGQQLGEQVKALHPAVKVISVNADRSIAQARDAGIRQASGELIAVLHERYTVTKDWIQVVLESQRAECDVVGGCVAPSTRLSSAAWAMYLSEYAHIAPPMPGGALDFKEATMLPGGNVSYKRQIFGLASMENALWELDFHAKLFQESARFVRNPEMIAEFAHPHTLREYLSERFHVSYDLAAQRAANMGHMARLAAALARVALPVLLSVRISMRVFHRRKNRFHLLIAFPWILFFSAIQTVGEARGYLFPRKTPGIG